ncbi:MAG: glutathionylspermidine synthase family protein [Proteobacteria bacterium]|nr:glutathionylspermidine synthase family protein [Pseudomonadota bacterium]
MKRITGEKIRHNWQEKVQNVGFYFYEIDGLPYWDESVHYELESDQIDHIESVTNELYEMCLKLVDYVLWNNLNEKLDIPEKYFQYAKKSWRDREPSIYGRFDFWYDGKSDPKLLEFNADTPTALFEASVVQYYWLQELYPKKDQFNSIHEKLLDIMEGEIKRFVGFETFYASSVKRNLEDYTTTEYIRDTAIQAGIKTEQVYIDDIGYDSENFRFVDLNNNPIRFLFKLYPWEWIIKEDFSQYLATTNITLLEPAWKMILSNKAILPILWEMYPGHKNLLPAYFEPQNSSVVYVEKPFFSREGEDIHVRDHFSRGKPQVIYQAYQELPDYSGNYPVVGSWIVGNESAGIGIREDKTPITNNLSRFVPHLFNP